MDKLEYNIEEIKILLIQVNNIVCSLNDEEFYDQLNSAREKMENVKLKKEALLKVYPKEDLLKYEENLNNLAKQIEKSFDNIIKQKYQEKCTVAEEIERLQNKKKLQNYRR